MFATLVKNYHVSLHIQIPNNTMSKITKWSTIGIILLLILGMIIYPKIKKKNNELISAPKSSQRGSRVLNIDARVLKVQTISDQVMSVGSTIPDEEVALSFESSGKLTAIYFKEGAYVRKGDLLAKINDKPLQAQLNKLKTQIPFLEGKVYRQKTLLAKDAVSQEAYESIETEYEKLKADIEIIESNIAMTELRAPFDGKIGLRSVSEGAYISPSIIVAHLAKTSPIKIDFSVPENYASEIKRGTNIIFSMENSKGILQDYDAKVYAVENTVDMNTRTLKVRASYPNYDGKIIPGRHISIIIEREKIENAIAIPSEAIIPEMGKNLLYLYKSGRAEPVEVLLGIRTEDRVQILSGVSPGDTLITTGTMQLRKGMRVSIDNLY